MSASTRVLFACLLAVLAWVPGPCRAETTAADRDAAEALFNQARAMMEQGDYAPACEKLRASMELDPAVGTALYLGDCYEKANRLASAWLAFEKARTNALEQKDRRAEIAAVRAAALKPRLVYLKVELTGERPEGLELRANGKVLELEALTEPMPIDEGPLTIVASAPGHDSAEVKLEILPGAKAPYRAIVPELRSSNAVAPAPTTPAATDAPPPSDDGGSGQRTVAFIVGGFGAAALLASGVFSILANGASEESADACDPMDRTRCSVRGKALNDDALGHAGVATVAGIVGGVALAAGVTLYVTAPTGPDMGFSVGIGGHL